MSENALRRKTGSTEALITWPITRMEWAGLPATVRERVRELMDEAVDLIELHSQGDTSPEPVRRAIPGVLACCHEWRASRIETDTAPVRHICNEPKNHPEETHRCSCGATLP